MSKTVNLADVHLPQFFVTFLGELNKSNNLISYQVAAYNQ